MNRDASTSSTLPPSEIPPTDRYLDPTERLEEVLFGLIMALTITLGAGLIVREGEDAVRNMLLGILGANLAWGLIDGGMYAMSCVLERSRRARLLEALQKARSPADAESIVAGELDQTLAPVAPAVDRARLYRAIAESLRGASPVRTRLTREDLLGALATAALVFVSAIPAVLPFLVFHDRFVALRVSNSLLLIMLFLAGRRWARATHTNPWAVGALLVVIGLVLVGIAIALGG